MISKSKFISIINALKSADKLRDDINDLMRTAKENIENDFMNAGGIMICHTDIVIDLLEEIMEDSYDTISWWIYETEYGKSRAEIYDREGINVIADLKTPEELYDYLENERIEKYE